MQGHSKGSGCINIVATLREELGGELDAFKAGLPPDSQALFSRKIVTLEWVPVAHVYPLFEALQKHYGGDEQKLLAIARRMCERDFSTFFRYFLKVLSPTYVLKKTALIWRTYNDTGELRVEQQESKGGVTSLVLVLDRFIPAPLFAVTTHAYIEQVLSMTGAKQLSVSRKNLRITQDTMRVEYHVSYAG